MGAQRSSTLFPFQAAALVRMGEGRRAYLASLLGCPISYLATTDANSCLLLSSDSWLASLLNSKRLPESFSIHPSLTTAEVASLLADQNCPHTQCRLLTVQVVDREDKEVVASSSFSSGPAPTLPDTVADVERANFLAAWQKNQELRSSCPEASPACSGIPWVQEVLIQVRKLWGPEVPIIPCSSEEEAIIASFEEMGEQQERPVLVPLLAVLVDQHHLVFLGQQPPASIAQLFTFSPAAIQGRQTKAHFLMFQLLQLFHRIENLGLFPGPLSLHQLHLSQSFLLQARHSMIGTTSPIPPHLPVIQYLFQEASTSA